MSRHSGTHGRTRRRNRRQRHIRGMVFRPQLEALENRILFHGGCLEFPPDEANVLVNDPCTDRTAVDTQSETSLVVFDAAREGDPSSSQRIVVVAYNDSASNLAQPGTFIGYARSTDGGLTFTDLGHLAGVNQGDPVLARSALTGTILLAHVQTIASGIGVARSTDDGQSFGLPVNASALLVPPSEQVDDQDQVHDKPWLTIDNHPGAGQGIAYVTWTAPNLDSRPDRIMLTRSTDDGQTWGPAGGVVISDDVREAHGSSVVVGPDHSVYVFWIGRPGGGTNPVKILMRRSTDLGLTFGETRTVAVLENPRRYGELGLEFQTPAFVQAAVNPVNGQLYVAFHDDPAGDDRGNIYLVHSSNHGETWGEPLRVNDDSTSNDQWLPSLSVTPDGRRVGLFWYDRRLDESNFRIDRFGTTAIVHSKRAPILAENFRVTTASFEPVYGKDPSVPTRARYMGDYDGVATDGDYFYTTWGDNRLQSRGREGYQADVRLARVALPGTPAQGDRVFAPQGVTEARFNQAERQDIYVTADDGVDLAVNLYRPDTSAEPNWKTPVILISTPYTELHGLINVGLERYLVERLTPRGYTVALATTRGFGRSGGTDDWMGPRHAQDFKNLVEYFADTELNPWASGKVGGFGASYSAALASAGAALQPNGLTTIVTVSPPTGLYSLQYFDGVMLLPDGHQAAVAFPGVSLIPSTPGADPVSSAELAAQHAVERFGASQVEQLQARDAEGTMTEWWQERESTLVVDQVQASVLYVHGLNDKAVFTNHMDNWYDELNSFKRAILGQWGHTLPYSSDEASFGASDDRWARDDWFATLHAWYDQELLGLNTGVSEWPKVQVQDERAEWRAVNSLEDMGKVYHLPLGEGVIGTAASAGDVMTYHESGLIVWDSPVLAKPLHFSGQATLDLTVSLDKDDAHFAVELQEVLTDGEVRLLTRGYLSAQHRESLTEAKRVPENEQVEYHIRTHPTDYWLGAGSHLRVVLSGFHNVERIDPMWGYPASLPAGNNYTANVVVDGRSVLHLPVAKTEHRIVLGDELTYVQASSSRSSVASPAAPYSSASTVASSSWALVSPSVELERFYILSEPIGSSDAESTAEAIEAQTDAYFASAESDELLLDIESIDGQELVWNEDEWLAALGDIDTIGELLDANGSE